MRFYKCFFEVTKRTQEWRRISASNWPRRSWRLLTPYSGFLLTNVSSNLNVRQMLFRVCIWRRNFIANQGFYELDFFVGFWMQIYTKLDNLRTHEAIEMKHIAGAPRLHGKHRVKGSRDVARHLRSCHIRRNRPLVFRGAVRLRSAVKRVAESARAHSYF